MNAELLKKMEALRTERETMGLNVRFVKEDGSEDCFSFATKERADAFRAKLTRQGRTVLN